VAWAFVAHTDGAFDEDLLCALPDAYQETRELTLGEMWALPTTLRVVLVENLRRLAERVATNKAAREVANLCCDQLADLPPSRLAGCWRCWPRGVGQPFLAQLGSACRTAGRPGPQARPTCTPGCRGICPTRPRADPQQSADQAADNLSVSNARDLAARHRRCRLAGHRRAHQPADALMLGVAGVRRRARRHARPTLHGIESWRGAAAQRGGGGAGAAAAPAGRRHRPRRWPATGCRARADRALLAQLGLREPACAAAWRALWPRVVLPAYLLATPLGTLGLVAWLLPHQPAMAAWGWLRRC
jgi:cyclic beta-1,2-glucan synthetase